MLIIAWAVPTLICSRVTCRKLVLLASCLLISQRYTKRFPCISEIIIGCYNFCSTRWKRVQSSRTELICFIISRTLLTTQSHLPVGDVNRKDEYNFLWHKPFSDWSGSCKVPLFISNSRCISPSPPHSIIGFPSEHFGLYILKIYFIDRELVSLFLLL